MDEFWCLWCGEPIDLESSFTIAEECGPTEEEVRYYCNDACQSAAHYELEREALMKQWEE